MDDSKLYWSETILTEILSYRTMEHFPGKELVLFLQKSLEFS